jgi:hypothetical protein
MNFKPGERIFYYKVVSRELQIHGAYFVSHQECGLLRIRYENEAGCMITRNVSASSVEKLRIDEASIPDRND